MNIGEALQNKIGGLPAWGWAAIVGGVILAYLWVFQRDTSPKPVNTSQSAASGSPVGEYDLTGAVSTAGGYGVNLDSADYGTVDGANISTDNQSWITRAVTRLGEEGIAGTNVIRALQRYITGSEISWEEQQITDRAIKLLGSPPEGLWGAAPDKVENPQAPAWRVALTKAQTALTSEQSWLKTLTARIDSRVTELQSLTETLSVKRGQEAQYRSILNNPHADRSEKFRAQSALSRVQREIVNLADTRAAKQAQYDSDIAQAERAAGRSAEYTATINTLREKLGL